MRISDWSSDVCSSDLLEGLVVDRGALEILDLLVEQRAVEHRRRTRIPFERDIGLADRQRFQVRIAAGAGVVDELGQARRIGRIGAGWAPGGRAVILGQVDRKSTRQNYSH